jgi:hypothetical protein
MILVLGGRIFTSKFDCLGASIMRMKLITGV